MHERAQWKGRKRKEIMCFQIGRGRPDQKKRGKTGRASFVRARPLDGGRGIDEDLEGSSTYRECISDPRKGGKYKRVRQGQRYPRTVMKESNP